MPRCNWHGFVQGISVGDHLAPAGIRMLPITDLNHGNKSCGLLTLLFVQDQAKKLNIETSCVRLTSHYGLRQLKS